MTARPNPVIDPDTGIPDLIRRLTDDSKRLVSDEVRLAKLEARDSLHRAARGGIWLALALGVVDRHVRRAHRLRSSRSSVDWRTGTCGSARWSPGSSSWRSGAWLLKRGLSTYAEPSYTLGRDARRARRHGALGHRRAASAEHRRGERAPWRARSFRVAVIHRLALLLILLAAASSAASAQDARAPCVAARRTRHARSRSTAASPPMRSFMSAIASSSQRGAGERWRHRRHRRHRAAPRRSRRDRARRVPRPDAPRSAAVAPRLRRSRRPLRRRRPICRRHRAMPSRASTRRRSAFTRIGPPTSPSRPRRPSPSCRASIAPSASITIVASAIFLLCIMLLKVDERRRDVAALRLIGCSERTIVRQRRARSGRHRRPRQSVRRRRRRHGVVSRQSPLPGACTARRSASPS